MSVREELLIIYHKMILLNKTPKIARNITRHNENFIHLLVTEIYFYTLSSSSIY